MKRAMQFLGVFLLLAAMTLYGVVAVLGTEQTAVPSLPMIGPLPFPYFLAIAGLGLVALYAEPPDGRFASKLIDLWHDFRGVPKREPATMEESHVDR